MNLTTGHLDLTEKTLLDLPKNTLILIYFCITLISDYLSILCAFFIKLGFSAGRFPPATFGYLARTFYIYYIVPVLLSILIISKNSRFSSASTSSLLRKISLSGLVSIIIYLLMTMATEGLQSRFNFFGYFNRNIAMLIYASIGFYLLFLFRHEFFPKTLLTIALGLIVVSEIWELPFNIFYLRDAHFIIFLLNTLRRFVPIFFWFYIFHKRYINFLRNRSSLALALVASITVLTFQQIVHPHFYVQVGLRLAYALLLIVFPFSFS